ncbi:MAG: tRNA (adenosine(37)-N6)-threonylcarbamoyltransferase complex dimerization subunit type 1 TsaB [Clostridiales bacterium]|nr:tRNA (adenosine(37)-N6)-threonylcarbamoyltransferase complex dimerization subunit type 1 TsaB [Clostridiales bacterium]
MYILAIETTGLKASVAIVDENMRIWKAQSDKKLSHLQNLIPLIADLLEKCKLKLDDITHIAVSEGPGSFTGIRIGVATGKALAQALDLPIISVPTLKSFAWHVPDFDGLICPIFDARREQVYAGAYFWQDGICNQAILDGAYFIDDFLKKIDEYDPQKKMGVLMMGDGLKTYKNALEDWKNKSKRKLSINDLLQDAESVAKLAYVLYKEGKIKSYEQVKPVYLRKAEAERKLEEGLIKGK